MGTIHVSPDGVAAGTTDLDRAVAQARPGDVIQLAPGEYHRTAAVEIRKGGQPGAPITIRGGVGVRLRGNPIIFQDGGFKIDPGFRFFHVVEADWIRFEALDFDHCWPRAIRLWGCRNIAIVKCTARRGKHFVWAESPPGGRLSERILMDGCSWVQEPDPAANRRLWSGEVQWCHIKHDDGPGECAPEFFKLDRTCYNGAMFGSRNLWGNVVIRNCDVSQAFNAIRMDCDAPPFRRVPGKPPMEWIEPKNFRNVNVRIHDNAFAFVRDNVTEPENFALNWWIFRNRVMNCYAPFAFDKLLGGYWFLFANLVYTDPAHRLTQVTDGHDVGQCFKFHSTPMPQWHLYSFHNSFLSPWPYAKEGQSNYWHSLNNAVEFMPPADGHGLPDYFRAKHQSFAWHPTNEFRGDASNHGDYPARLIAGGWDVDPNGLATDRIFAKAWGGGAEKILALLPNSPARHRSTAGHADYVHWWYEPKSFAIEAGQHVGAMQEYGLYRGPDFKPYVVDDVDARRIGIEEGVWNPDADVGA